jgi:small GTP-binding protein
MDVLELSISFATLFPRHSHTFCVPGRFSGRTLTIHSHWSPITFSELYPALMSRDVGEATDHQLSFKFVLVGDSAVGKTALCKKFCDKSFNPNQPMTVGLEFGTRVVEVQKVPIKLQIWDTAGQERFRSIAKAYFRSAIGVILVFDLADRRSFDDMNQWLSDVHTLCDPNAVVTLIGNKSDLDGRAVTAQEAESFGKLHQLSYLETSALNGSNIEEAFRRTAATIYRRSLVNKAANQDDNGEDLLQNKRNAGGCC